MPLDPSDLYCLECLNRAPKYCKICQCHDQFKELPTPVRIKLEEMSKGEPEWRKLRI